MPACAITDHGNLFGAAYFFQGCKDFGIKPIFGCEVYVCQDHTDKSTDSPLARRRNHLILLAQNSTGYHNLVKLVTKGYLEGFYYKPRVDKALLRKYSEGLVCLSACIAGEIPRAIRADDMAFVGIEDLTGHAEVTFFPRPYAECRDLLRSEQPICLVARLDSQTESTDSGDTDEDGEEAPRELKLLGQKATSLSAACGLSDTPVCVHIPPHRLGREDMAAKSFYAALHRRPGTGRAAA